MAVEPEKHDDDDRVICRMDVEGMPQRGIAWNFLHPRGKQAATWPMARRGELTHAETRRYAWYSLLAGLLVVFVFSIALVLFTLFCTNVWFH